MNSLGKKKQKSRSEKDLTRRFMIGGIVVLVSALVLSLGFIIILSILGISFFAVAGNSMQPTLNHGDNIVLKKDDGVMKGQIFLFNKPPSWGYMGNDTPLLIKRTEAAPGDVLSYEDGVFSVNGEETFNTTEEDYQCDPGVTEYSHELKQHEVYAVGDNVHESLDSRRIFCDGDIDDMYVSTRDLVDYGTIISTF